MVYELQRLISRSVMEAKQDSVNQALDRRNLPALQEELLIKGVRRKVRLHKIISINWIDGDAAWVIVAIRGGDVHFAYTALYGRTKSGWEQLDIIPIKDDGDDIPETMSDSRTGQVMFRK